MGLARCLEHSGPKASLRYRAGQSPGGVIQHPAATFDLHGQSVLEAVHAAELFLRAQARVRPGASVRLITGRGRGGHGAPIRTRVRTLLRRLKESGTIVRDFELEGSEGSYLVRLR